MKQPTAGLLIAAGAVAVRVMITLTAPAAGADPGTGTQEGCVAAGGNWSTVTRNGHTYTSCCDIPGQTGCDIYEDGTYIYTATHNAPPGGDTGPSQSVGPRPPAERPTPPPGARLP
ncbi:hypothetical protein MNVI_22620 [Mycobacterium noviomagense]|uniref:Uncharacterized protein n=1 Tax=Mycobacterium noviomagense TaxID=459858 RepID=A0A7I7PE95_9MYCO|nr:hypothetical protein MNVI_22620 [Mycobacterium noviomagense]